jgi:hypothetical protein
VDDDDGVIEKKSNRNKKSITQQQSIDRSDSTIDNLLTIPSINSTNIDTHELPTPNNLDQFAPLISVEIEILFFLKINCWFCFSKQLMHHLV